MARAKVSLSLPAAICAASMMLASAPWVSHWMTPRVYLAQTLPPINLSAQLPEKFGEWREDVSNAQVLPDPTVQAQLDNLYSQVLTRTYVNPAGQQVMLTIAYGSDQNSEATAAHRPEFCYRAQGFEVRDLGLAKLPMQGHELTTRRLVGTYRGRIEPIVYWVTLADRATLPGLGRKLAQITYGLRGQVADGMLVRVSTIGADLDDGFAIQGNFIRAMEQAVAPTFRARYFGS